MTYLRWTAAENATTASSLIADIESCSEEVGKLLQPLTQQLYTTRGSREQPMWKNSCINLTLMALFTLLTISNGEKHLSDRLRHQVRGRS